MHSKQTVLYICESYPSGNDYYYKKELITHDCWENIDSITWSAPRPISKQTFLKREKEGYKTKHIQVNKKAADVLPFIKNDQTMKSY